MPVRPACLVLTFSLQMLDAVRDMANDHFLHINGDPTVRLSRFDCLIAVLWKALTRARWPYERETEGRTTSLVIPINIRQSVEPALNASYYGNSDLYSHTLAKVVQLGLPFDVSAVGNAAHGVRRSFSSLTEAKVRSAIAIINDVEDVRSVAKPCINYESDVLITNWMDLPVGEETTLGMGLGPAEWTRKLSRDHSSFDCVLLPPKSGDGFEVMVELAEPEMKRMLEDTGLGPFLLGSV